MIFNLLRRLKNRLVAQAGRGPTGEAPPAAARQKKIFLDPPDLSDIGGGYAETGLNEYIVLKTAKWFEQIDPDNFKIPAHLYGLLFVLETASLSLGRPVNVTDFGGGAPVLPWVAKNLGIPLFGKYRVIEQETFLKMAPPSWAELAEYSSSFGTEPIDALVLSSVLPYIGRDDAERLFATIEALRPTFIYLGRTAFLPEEYPHDEVYTIQESVFKDHGPQIPTGLTEIEQRVARYPRRHFKRSTIDKQLAALSYRRKVSLQDDSGVEVIENFQLYSYNSLWELAK